MTKEERAKETKRWMDWYYNRGGREKVLAKRRNQGYLSKEKYLELTQQNINKQH